MLDIEVIGPRIKFLRESKGLSQKQVIDNAKSKKLAVKTLSRLETGDGNPTLSTIQEIADAMGVSALDLLTQSPDEKKPLDYRGAAELLSKFSSLPVPYQQVVLALVHRDPARVKGISDKIHKLAQALISAL